MTGGERTALWLGGALAAALAVWALATGQGTGLSVSIDAGDPDGGGEVTDALDPDAGYDRSHWHLCMPSDMPHRVTGRHPLYRRPVVSSPNFSGLAQGGWEWFCDPPSELGG